MLENAFGRTRSDKKEEIEEFQEEMNMFNQAFLEIMQKGDAKGRVFTFPIPIIKITKKK